MTGGGNMKHAEAFCGVFLHVLANVAFTNDWGMGGRLSAHWFNGLLFFLALMIFGCAAPLSAMENEKKNKSWDL